MCGIVGYVGSRQAAPLLLEALARLEYRGYDSAGVALVQDRGVIEISRTTQGLPNLGQKISSLNGHAFGANIGIAHTRWATHGRATEENAHPHRSADGKVAIVHNGIFENHREILDELARHGLTPKSQTDTECFPMLMSHLLAQGATLDEAFRGTIARMRGLFSLVCLHADHPEKLLLARFGAPLVVGIGTGENFVASDVTALLDHTRDVVFIEDGAVAELGRDGLRVAGATDEPAVQRIEWDRGAIELGEHTHYMHKEIFEQPEAIARVVDAHRNGDEIELDLPFSQEFVGELERVVILACGTSYHAGLVAKFAIEELAGIPVEVDYASEYRYRGAVGLEKSLALAITQSGETADTLAALKEARHRGARTLAICNVVGSQATRIADGTLLTRAGPEVGVASTKAFTTQLAVLLMLAVHLGKARHSVTTRAEAAFLAGLRDLPETLRRVSRCESRIQALAEEWHRAKSALYLGRGALYPIALEGALKLKEISYLHAEGYPAGEMKHGPIALVDSELPVFALVPNDDHRERMLSNLQEAASRDGKIIAFVNEGDSALGSIAQTVIELPAVARQLAPIAYAVPLQLLAYHVAVRRGCNVDRPRNLAKSVTVE